MTGIRLDWSAIRPLNGGRDKGFEELCAQLARAESPVGATFVRKGTPDAGVECYAVLSDGSEWGWQSKYVDTLGDSQWAQIDGSIKTALEKHPKLVRYFVCVPLDRADARLDGRRSAMERWNDHVAKWNRWASARAMKVEFVFWGNHELIDRLTDPKHTGRVRFWFDTHGFDGAWFSARLDEALRTAGPRYTPEVHLELPVAWEFEAFGRTNRFFEREKAAARKIRKAFEIVELSKGVTDQAVDDAVRYLASKVGTVLTALGAIHAQPTGPLAFNGITAQIRSAEEAAESLARLLREREKELAAKPDLAEAEMPQPRHADSSFRERRFRLNRLVDEFQEARESLTHAERVAGSKVLLLRGNAGTGKTHLLCDVARHRITSGCPTVLLLGQWFIGNEAPWTQALQHLDLTGLSAEQFVGALEAAAQAAGSRALLIIDALNEGQGRSIWPSHLASFLAHLERSPWIGVVLSIRSSYEEIVIPEDVRDRVAGVTHRGFADHEYDATRTFFVYYGLELPSTPLLAPEFQNPLFLKTLCQGLQAKGEHRLPRGFHGITAVFDLYLNAINGRLAASLGFDKRTPLVRRALEAVARATLDTEQHWLTLTEAAKAVDAFLPGREYERSLYRGLVVEGLLVEDVARREVGTDEEVVSIAYERFADHLAVKILLDRHLVAKDPASAFAQDGPLAFVCDEKHEVSPGILEALCIQLPERTGHELISVAPSCEAQWGLEHAFRQSLIWRAYTAISGETIKVMSKLCTDESDLHATLDVLLTLAVLPEHPLNARWLDERLRSDVMPDRDAWWSIYLHQAWRTHGAVDRIVDWAFMVRPDEPLDDEAVELCVIALAWMLTSSNRFLRDRATIALVNLLTRRLATVRRLVEWSADVDDPYVVERVYAVAYGAAMRSHDPGEVGVLAKSVFERVFSSQSPPPHVLLRDYARGVVERALHLGSVIDVVPDRIRPPYRSTWPVIPTEEDIAALVPDWSKGSYDSGELEWAKNRIFSSVMDDDFARYVIGTNSSPTSSNWLALGLDAPPWMPPARPKDLLRHLVGDLSDAERKAWDELEAASSALDAARESFEAEWFKKREQDGNPIDLVLPSERLALKLELEKAKPPKVAEMEEKVEQAEAVLESVLTKEHAQRLEEIWRAFETDEETRRPPRFELGQVQRYVLKRVFDLGWTAKRFGHFDRFAIGYKGREAAKAERIGKKYQWIAYHEIMAFVSDHFQYREQFRGEEADQAYEGPWQEHLRDIDPSCIMRSLRGGTSWEGHTAAWWGAARYDSWAEKGRHREWVLDAGGLPKVEDLLLATNPADGSRWLNGQGYFDWQQQPPADREPTDVERGEIWYICTGYLLRLDDAQKFLSWAEGVDFWGRWMPNTGETYRMFLGEYPWAPASRYFQKQYYGDDGWTQPGHGCPVQIRTLGFEYMREGSGFDCSIDEGFTLRLPASEIVMSLGLRWSGTGADFIDEAGRVSVQDPTVHAEGPNALLLREDLLRQFLERERLTICWAVVGEKRVLGAGFIPGARYPAIRMSGAYVLGDRGPVGFTKHFLDDPEAVATSLQLLGTVRCGM